MKRIVYVDTDLQKEKFVLLEEYNGFGIYQEKCPTGYFVHQSWLITNGNITLVFYSFNNYCKEELLDAIDNYNDIRRFGVKAMKHPNNLFVVHPNGNVSI